jgi:hypothetical protein
MIIRCSFCDSSFRLNPLILKNFKGARVSCRRCGASIVAMNPLIPSLPSKRKNSEPFSVAPSITPPVDGHANREILPGGNRSTYPKQTAPKMETWTPPQKTENVDVRPEGETGIPNTMKSPMPITLKKEFVLKSPSEVLPHENRFQWWMDIALLLLIALFAGLFGYSLS